MKKRERDAMNDLKDAKGAAGPRGLAGRLAALFLNSRLTPIALVASVALGAFATIQLPREEEPQIQVPMIDVFVGMPGVGTEEVENRVTRPMEKLLWEVPGVEYIYSTSSPGSSLAVVRFQVGHPLESAIVKLNQKLQSNYDRIPLSVGTPLIKPRTIDDVPVLALTFHSAEIDHFGLRRIAAQVDDAIKSLPEVAETQLLGGLRRQVRVQIDPVRLASRQLTLPPLVEILRQSNARSHAGVLVREDTEWLLEAGGFLPDAAAVGSVVVGVFHGVPVYLRDVADIFDGPEEPSQYVLFQQGSAGSLPIGTDPRPAVTLSVAKKPGANAVEVVGRVLAQVEQLQGRIIPSTVELTITRDYGATAAEKSNELLLHMGIAVFGVALLIFFFLGFRESVVVMLAIPSTLALTLVVFYFYGYTLNRITLFALIFSIGILVDDAIVVVENIVRHVRMPANRARPVTEVALEAVAEVGNPTILATLAVVAAILPMAFVGGLMGPYMRPIPIGATAAMLFSLLIAFIVTPWASVRLLNLRHHAGQTNGDEEAPDDWMTRVYHRVMDPLLASSRWRAAFLGGIALLLAASGALVLLGRVTVKMLPFDNKSEFQVILDLPEGTSLERTAAVALEMAHRLRQEPEVSHLQIYAGTASPFNFNGLVRHYFLRQGSHLADIQVNLADRHNRRARSHEIAKRVRAPLEAIAHREGATLAVAEVPPGPPVLQTLVAEIYGPDDEARLALAQVVRDLFESAPDVVDVDWYVEGLQPKLEFKVDQEKAALLGITEKTVAQTLAIALSGLDADLLHLPREREDVPIRFELPRQHRTSVDDLLAIQVSAGPGAPLIPLRDLVDVRETVGERNRYRKNLMPVTYVTADVAGKRESPAYVILEMNRVLRQLKAERFGGGSGPVRIYNASQPASDHQPAIKWDGEWHITLEVFRDLGLAFAAVLVLIYMLMVGWFRSYLTPLVVMVAIPFSLIGILPAHWAMGAFFTATSMIGFMAGAGIVVRNSIILVDFIELRRSHGVPLAEAVVEAGAVRFRPMLLTALAVVVGAAVILADPIFEGLAISLMFGEVASLLISRMAVPVLYFMANRKRGG